MNYKKGPIIGSGSTATVLLATTVTGGLVAVKSTELSSSQLLQKERQLLSELSSPHVIKYIGFDIDYIDNKPMYNLVMEYANGGSISDVIKKQGGKCLDECLIKSYTYQILLGLDYIHSNNLVHCDIKCSNILVCDNVVKIGDLGCAKYVGNGEDTSSVFSGTPVFMAPEVARGEEQMFAADVWALGCAVIEMATGCNPWPELNNPVSALYTIGHSDDVPLIPMWLSVEGQDFLKKCLQRNVEERWTVKELLDHPFVSSKPCFEKIENLSKESPISILDQGFWDSLEEPEISAESVSGESPVERIRQLVEASPSCLPNWVDEHDWIAVRISHIDEISKISEHDSYTDVAVEDNEDIELSHTYSISVSEMDVFEEVSNSFRVMLGSDVDETSSAIVVAPSFLDCKNMNNDNCLHIDSILQCFASFVRFFR